MLRAFLVLISVLTASVFATGAAGQETSTPAPASATPTVDPGFGCPCSIWSDAARPFTEAEDDPGAYELGVKFRAQVGGQVTGVRFYKGSGNTGTHLGRLRSSTGAL